MKKPSRFIAVLCLLAALFLSACAKAPAEAPAEAAVTTAQTPTHSPTESHATDASAPEASAEISTDNGSAPFSLSGTRWNLNTIYVNGDEQRPSVRYGHPPDRRLHHLQHRQYVQLRLRFCRLYRLLHDRCRRRRPSHHYPL